MAGKPSVLFVCVHNAGRSQMAAGYLTHLAGNAIEVRSAGSAPADSVNPTVIEAMREEGIINRPSAGLRRFLFYFSFVAPATNQSTGVTSMSGP